MDEFANICGYDEARGELERLASYLRDEGHLRGSGSHAPSGLLIEGRPGLGKTLMAEDLVRASGRPSFVVRKDSRGDALLEKIRQAFDDAAKAAPSVVLLDDLDKFANDDYDHTDAEGYVAVQACMDAHRGEGVFVVATANDAGKLPASLLRPGRLGRTISLDVPLGADARAIVAHYLEGVPCGADLDVRGATDVLEGSTCALIEGVANEACLLAAYEGDEGVSLLHLLRAYVRAEGGGTLSAPSASDPPSLGEAWGTERAQCAYHEAGHAVVQEALVAGSSSVAALVERQGRLGGLAKPRNVAASASFEDVRRDVLVSVAGGLAVERAFGTPCLGCSSDNEQAAKQVDRLMWDATSLGPYVAGRGRWDTSECLLDVREQAGGAVLEMLRWEARSMLARRWQAVERVAGMLYERGYVLPGEVEDAVRETA